MVTMGQTHTQECHATGLEDAVCDKAESLSEKAGDAASSTIAKAKAAAEYVGAKADDATRAAGAGMESAGHAVRAHTPDHGVLASAGSAIANKLENAGHYVEQSGLRGLGDDVTNLIRRNPIPALLLGVGIGVLLARMARR
jgi:hypothetical protein